MQRFILITFLFLVMVPSRATVTLPRVIGNNMVLQRGRPVPIWGYATAGEEISVSFGSQVEKTRADASGNWRITLDPLTASAKPSLLKIAGGNTIVLNNILVGEVWLCSGQSNMEYTMRKNSKVTLPAGGADWPVNELETAHNPAIRIFLVNRKTLKKPNEAHDDWSVAEDSALRSFSAAGYFFAKELQQQLGVPVGIISSAIPGSRLEPWAPKEAFTALPYFKDKKIDGEPGKFYGDMIQPLAPFALQGFLWYQGESNCFLADTVQYTYKMKALLDYWRKAWNNNGLAFYYVEIAPFLYSTSKGAVVLTEETLPKFREAQAALQAFPNTAMVSTIDLNEKLEELHPHFKWEIGKRLAWLALGKTYGKKVVYTGPVYKSMRRTGASVEIEFSNAGDGLKSKDGKPLTWFTIAGPDGKFVPANAVIKGNKVIVSSSLVSEPKAVRFAWNEAAIPNLYNSAGLPAFQFRTDNPIKLDRTN